MPRKEENVEKHTEDNAEKRTAEHVAENIEGSIEVLLEEVQREAAELRAHHGESRVPPLETPERALAALATAPATSGIGRTRGIYTSTLAELRRHLNPANVEISSHRGTIGHGIVAAKRLLTKLLTPVLESQAAFHQATIDALEQLEKSIGYEVRERLDALDRRITNLENATGVRERSGSTAAFDYPAFEDAFRGSAEDVARAQERYLEYFPDATCGPVLDLGCGRGEFLGLLKDRNITAFGVDLESRYVEAGRAAGLDIREEDAAIALQECDDSSLGGIVAFQVFEHLTLERISRILELARHKLRPGGVLILETVNVASLITHARAFTLDPTHELALHPLALKLLVEGRGFADVEIVYGGEVEDDVRLDPAGLEPRVAENLERLNRIVFAPQDYAIVARA